jgi:hypothetical protein
MERTMDETLSVDFSKPFAVFPLNGVVLLPHTLLGLHIFESRYREMAGDALNSIGLIAMGQFANPVGEEEYLHGRPPLRPCVCVGHIRQYEALDDGRYLLLLLGLFRARIEREIPHEPYRTVVLQPFDLELPNRGEWEPRRREILELAEDPVVGAQLDYSLCTPREVRAAPVHAMVDLLTAASGADSEDRYRMLAESRLSVRADWLTARLTRLRDAEAP